MIKQLKKLLFGTAGVLSALLISGCSILPAEEELPDKPVLNDAYKPKFETHTVRRATLDTSNEGRATYHAAQSSELSFSSAGTLYEICVKKGDHVTKGMLLASYDCTELYETLEGYYDRKQQFALTMRQLSEKKELELQKLTLRIRQKEMEMDAAAQEEKQQLQLELEALETSLAAVSEEYDAKLQSEKDEQSILELKIQIAEQAVADARIVAPYDGIVTMVEKVKVGESLARNERLMTVDSADPGYFLATEAVFEIGTTYQAKTYAGVNLRVTAVAAPDAQPTEERPLLTDYLVLTDESMRIAGGTLIIVGIPGVVREDALYIRQEAVHELNGETYVYVLQDGKAVMRDVELGVAFGATVEIIEGLKEGEEVVI